MTYSHASRPVFNRLSSLALMLSLAFAAACIGQGAAGQESPFATAVSVNGLSITNYEVDQRRALLTLLRAPGDLTELAREQLIEDRLRESATRAAGITATPEQIRAGMEEFAGRANLSANQFISELANRGVPEETFRDFVSSGIAWRQLVRGRFGPRVAVSDAELDRALSLSTQSRGGVRVLLSEIIVPIREGREDEARALVQRLSETIESEAAFSAAAREYSATPTRARGGRLDWLPIGRLPPALRGQVLTLAPGEVTEPVNLGPGIAIFQLRDLEETDGTPSETLALEYVSILIPTAGGTDLSQAGRYDALYDTCDDLYEPAQSMADGQFTRDVLPASEVPADIALELARLDPDESSAALTRQNGAFRLYLKLCARTVDVPVNEDGEAIDLRAQTREQIFQRRLTSFADSYLEELRADAIIVEG
ncbi:chaperone SurA [Litoreibacter roseus]|uniref:Parvulin-like PPIase n=2 Tax=Litoreibacter roseus TaxID=2601869 RepID=A0A6N6JFR4_9RHOB|nr:chaperone SurA [Litoreibacter roseus]